MLLISPNFDVKSIIFFPILARGLFPKLLEKALLIAYFLYFTGYNGDIICLQEVDRKVYLGELLFVFDTQGFEGSFKAKGGTVAEGSAIFFRKSKFR